MTKSRPKVLGTDEVPLTRLCDQRWEDLSGGGERARHCSQCETSVTNLSAMGRAEAAEFLAELNGPRCLAYRYRADGTILFTDTLRRRKKPRGLALAGAALLAAACSGSDSRDIEAAKAENTEALASPAEERVSPTPPVEQPAPEEEIGQEPSANRTTEIAEQLRAENIDCDTYRQLMALGAYGAELPQRCEEED